MTEIITHWINGAPADGASDRTAPVYDPALGVITKNVRLGSAADVDTAVAAAAAAFPAWSETSWAKRIQVLFSFRELLNARRQELAEILTSEHGKVLSDAFGEITRGLEVVEFALGMPHLAKGEYTDNASTGVDVYSLRQPLGVVGIITPFNFPAMVPLWFFPIAIAAGNTVVLKPSEKDPSSSVWLAKLLKEAGLPDGVFNVVHGDKESVDALLAHPDVESI
jgi:malonate-semialdehyde dehydrogenase (acetylating)/methylmalonate-semialdehyde dehydrogenase